MRSAVPTSICLAALALSAVLYAGTQERPAGAAKSDPRVGLKAGLRDAGQAVRNMELVSSLAKPEGFFDPTEPAGVPTAPERDPKEAEKEDEAARQAEARGEPPSPARQRAGSALNFANSDLAFQGRHLFIGNYHGFNTYDIENARRP